MTRKAGFEVIGPTLVAMEDRGEVVGGQPEMAVPQVPPPRMFWEKRLQTIENTGREDGKEGKEMHKRRQVAGKKGDATEARLRTARH